MQDPRLAMLTTLKFMLDPIGLPVYSVVPSNSAEPFIYIGEIETQQDVNKDHFQLSGTFNVELYTGSNAYTGSLTDPLTWLNQIKEIMQPNRSSVLDLGPQFIMQYLLLFNDTGLNQYSSDEKLYNAIVQYEFMMTNYTVTVQNVIHNGVDVVFNGEQVVWLT